VAPIWRVPDRGRPMSAPTSRLFRFMGGWIKPFRAPDTPPPQKIVPFMVWTVKGTWPAMLVGAVAASIAGSTEVISASLLGYVIDLGSETGIEGFFTQTWAPLLAIALFLLVLRPLAFGFNTTMQGIVLTPNVNVLVLSRLHRWTMGQSVTFFDNDFAG